MIHIKAQYENEFRRFVLDGASYSKLHSTILELYQIPLNLADLVLKYLDEENELVTFSTDFELETAMTLTPNLLRIVISVNRRNEIENEKTECSSVEHYQENEEDEALADLPPWLRRKIRCRRASNETEADNEEFSDLPHWIQKRILKVRGQWDKDACPRKWKKDGNRRWKGGRHGCHGNGHGAGNGNGHGNGRSRGRGRRGRWNRGWEMSTESETSSSGEMTLTEVKAEIASLKGERKVLTESKKEVVERFRAQKAAVQEARRNGEEPEYVTELRSQLDELKQEKKNKQQILRATTMKLKKLNFKRKELVILASEADAGEENSE